MMNDTHFNNNILQKLNKITENFDKLISKFLSKSNINLIANEINHQSRRTDMVASENINKVMLDCLEKDIDEIRHIHQNRRTYDTEAEVEKIYDDSQHGRQMSLHGGDSNVSKNKRKGIKIK